MCSFSPVVLPIVVSHWYCVLVRLFFLRRDNEFKSVFLFCVPGHMSHGSN